MAIIEIEKSVKYGKVKKELRSRKKYQDKKWRHEAPLESKKMGMMQNNTNTFDFYLTSFSFLYSKVKDKSITFIVDLVNRQY